MSPDLLGMCPPNSQQCCKSELDLFSPPNVQTSIIGTLTNTVHPINTLSGDNAPLEFFIPGVSELYIDPSSIRIYIKYKIEKLDGTDIDSSSLVYGENYLISSLFSNAEVELNGVLVSSNANTYAYRAYLETELNYSTDAKKSLLRSGGYYVDENAKKKIYPVGKKIHSIFGRIHSDLFNQDRLIPNGVNLKIKLTRSSNSFALITSPEDVNEYKIIILETYLVVHRVKLNSSLQMQIEKRLLTETAKLPITRVVCRQFVFNSGLLQKRIDNITLGALPTNIFLGLVKHASLVGSYKESGLKFEHFNLKSIEGFVNGTTIEKKYSLNYNKSEEDIAYAYHKLHERICGASIDYEDFKSNLNIYGFTLSQDYSLGSLEYINPTRQGSLSLALEFSKAIENPISLIVYVEFEDAVEIDKSRNILINY